MDAPSVDVFEPFVDADVLVPQLAFAELGLVDKDSFMPFDELGFGGAADAAELFVCA